MPYRCLIVEDQALIAMALEASLEDAGFEVAGLFGTNAAALNWLSSNTPEIALLDLLLPDGVCCELARLLRERGIPFAIYSGVLVPKERPAELQDVPWLEKPVSREALATTLAQLGSSACPQAGFRH
ncbi:MAG TPA: response regulator [Microvirga sp.]|jgi:DNA-binding response OmpR family regulator